MKKILIALLMFTSFVFAESKEFVNTPKEVLFEYLKISESAIRTKTGFDNSSVKKMMKIMITPKEEWAELRIGSFSSRNIKAKRKSDKLLKRKGQSLDLTKKINVRYVKFKKGFAYVSYTYYTFEHPINLKKSNSRIRIIPRKRTLQLAPKKVNGKLKWFLI